MKYFSAPLTGFHSRLMLSALVVAFTLRTVLSEVVVFLAVSFSVFKVIVSDLEISAKSSLDPFTAAK